MSTHPNAQAKLPGSPASLLPVVLQAMASTPDPRLRQLMASLTTHLHQFVLQNHVTEAEFQQAVGFVVGIGQATGETKNEVILAADLLGVSTLVALLNNPGRAGGDSHAALLGPFWRANAPLLARGQSMAQVGASDGASAAAGVAATQGTPMDVRGCVFGADGQPLAGAIVDAWQADPKGLYENQDPKQPDMNLRGRYTCDAKGRYHLRTITPAGYPVPTDGPCGELLRAQRRAPHRPAHLHFMVSHPGHRLLVTQVFPGDDPHLYQDPVFGVTQPLVGQFRREQQGGHTVTVLSQDFHLVAGELLFPHPPIP